MVNLVCPVLGCVFGAISEFFFYEKVFFGNDQEKGLLEKTCPNKKSFVFRIIWKVVVGSKAIF